MARRWIVDGQELTDELMRRTERLAILRVSNDQAVSFGDTCLTYQS
jgi:hypothetical protein